MSGVTRYTEKLRLILLVLLLFNRVWTTAQNSAISACENTKVYSHLRVTWKIDNFTRDYVEKCRPSTNKDSDAFDVMMGELRTKWILRIYPNGDFRKQGVIAIFLIKKDESSQNYEYSCRFSIMKDDKVVITSEFKAQPGSIDELGSGRGFLEFLTHKDLFGRFDKFVEHSQLTIRADIELLPPKKEAEIFLKSLM